LGEECGVGPVRGNAIKRFGRKNGSEGEVRTQHQMLKI